MEKDKTHSLVNIPVGEVVLKGNLVIPKDPVGLVIFSHGSGSSRLSPRNNFVAGKLNDQHFATLLFDLLTPEEDSIYENRFDIELLTERLAEATHWIAKQPELEGLQLGYFGASTGAAAALVAGAKRADSVYAIVSRGGRPDLAAGALPHVRAPTLLIVGGNDVPVIEMNKRAMKDLRADNRLAIVPGATHLFEEPGALEEVARLAGNWFLRYVHRTRRQPVTGLKS